MFKAAKVLDRSDWSKMHIEDSLILKSGSHIGAKRGTLKEKIALLSVHPSRLKNHCDAIIYHIQAPLLRLLNL